MSEQQPAIQHTSKLWEWKGEQCSVFQFQCPGCSTTHGYTVYVGSDKGWSFDGNYAHPTFTPSLRVLDFDGKTTRCHLNITAGEIHYHGDCPHALAGKVVPMEDI